MRINNNLLAMNTHRQMGITQGSQTKSMEKLSSGYRINRAGDDAAGLAISEKMRSQIKGLNQASRNSQDAISLIQTAEGALNETQNILQRMRELSVQSANDTNVDADREEIQKEMNQLTSEINRIGNTTEFNTMKLLDGSKKVEYKATKAADIVSPKAETISISYSSDVVEGSDLKDSIDFNGENKIKIDKTEPNWQAATNAGSTATITITKSTEGELKIEMAVQNTAGASVLDVDDTITANSAGDFVYDANGVSFTIKADDYKDMGAATANNKLEIGVTATEIAAGEKATVNDWKTNDPTSAGAAIATMTSGITITSDIDASARKVMISSDGTVSGGGTVNVYIQNSAGDDLSKDTYTWTAGGTVGGSGSVLEYDNHGVQFKLDLEKSSEAVIEKDLTTETEVGKTTYTVESDDSLKFQVGANQDQQMNLVIEDMRSSALNISGTAAGTLTYTKDDGTTDTINLRSTGEVTDGTSTETSEFALDVTDFENASKAITVLNNAIKGVSSERSKLGAIQNRLEHTIANLDTSAENLQASESRIRDVDMAKEMMQFSKNNILQQAAQSMLAQANQAPQGVLQLLR